MAPSNHLTKIFQNFLPMHVRELLPRILSEDSLRIPAYVPYENSSGVSLEFFSRVFPDCLPCVLPAISKILYRNFFGRKSGGVLSEMCRVLLRHFFNCCTGIPSGDPQKITSEFPSGTFLTNIHFFLEYFRAFFPEILRNSLPEFFRKSQLEEP